MGAVEPALPRSNTQPSLTNYLTVKALAKLPGTFDVGRDPSDLQGPNGPGLCEGSTPFHGLSLEIEALPPRGAGRGRFWSQSLRSARPCPRLDRNHLPGQQERPVAPGHWPQALLPSGESAPVGHGSPNPVPFFQGTGAPTFSSLVLPLRRYPNKRARPWPLNPTGTNPYDLETVRRLCKAVICNCFVPDGKILQIRGFARGSVL